MENEGTIIGLIPENCNTIIKYLSSIVCDEKKLTRKYEDTNFLNVVHNKENFLISQNNDDNITVSDLKSKNSRLNIEKFQNRLLSFEYGNSIYLKVSPLFCAKFGWILKERHILQCTTCSAVISASLPMEYEHDSYNYFLNNLKQRIQFGHKMWCGWKDISCPESFVHPPSFLTVHYLKTLTNDIRSFNKFEFELPYLQCTKLLKSLNLDENHLLSLYSRDEELNTSKIITALLTLFGWTFDTTDRIKCTICLRTVGLWNFLLLSNLEEYEALQSQYEQKQERIKLKREKITRKLKREQRRLENDRLRQLEKEEKEKCERKEREKEIERSLDEVMDQSDNEVTGEEESFLLEGKEPSLKENAEIDSKCSPKLEEINVSESQKSMIEGSIENCGKQVSENELMEKPEAESNHENNDEKNSEDIFSKTATVKENVTGSIIIETKPDAESSSVKTVSSSDNEDIQQIYDSSSEDEGEQKVDENGMDDLWMEAMGCDRKNDSVDSSPKSLYSHESNSPRSNSPKEDLSNLMVAIEESSNSSISRSDSNPSRDGTDSPKAIERKCKRSRSESDNSDSSSETPLSSVLGRKRKLSFDTTDSNSSSNDVQPSKILCTEESNCEAITTPVLVDSCEEEFPGEQDDSSSESDCSSIHSEDERDSEEDLKYFSMRSRIFDPLQQHRLWCGWVSKCKHASGNEESAWAELRGFQIIPPQLKTFTVEPPKGGSYLNGDRFKNLVDGLRSIRQTLTDWELPEDKRSITVRAKTNANCI